MLGGSDHSLVANAIKLSIPHGSMHRQQIDVYEGTGDNISGDGYWGPGLMYAWQPWSGHYVVRDCARAWKCEAAATP